MSCLRDRDFGELVSLWPGSGRGGGPADPSSGDRASWRRSPKEPLSLSVPRCPHLQNGGDTTYLTGCCEDPKGQWPMLVSGIRPAEVSGSRGWMDCPCLVYTKEVHGFAGDAESLAVRGAGSERFCASSPGPISVGLQRVRDRELGRDCSVLSWPWLAL